MRKPKKAFNSRFKVTIKTVISWIKLYKYIWGLRDVNHFKLGEGSTVTETETFWAAIGLQSTHMIVTLTVAGTVISIFCFHISKKLSLMKYLGF